MSYRRQRHDRNDRHKNHNNNAHLIGTAVSVVQKQDQPTGRLTTGVVAEILTNCAVHPRGIKVRLQDGTVGRIQAGESGGADFRNNNHGDHDDHAPRGGSSLADFMPIPQQRPIVVPASRIAVEAEETSLWSCPACTFLNSNLLAECELCQTSKVES